MAERQIAAHLPNACVVRNPVNLANFNPVPYPNSDVVKMANVARLDAQCKGQDVLLEVPERRTLEATPLAVALLWRWCRPTLSGATDRALSTSPSKVEFCGHVGDVRSIWADNHLLVMPSRSEGTPLSLVEAMICGRPSVVTDVGGNIEWVDEPSTGFVAEAPSARSLNNALERAWEARERWESDWSTCTSGCRIQVRPASGGSRPFVAG